MGVGSVALRGLGCVGLAWLCAFQTAGVVDPNPTPPPAASWPVFVNEAALVGGPGTDFADIGTGRGQALVDVLGPDPLDPGNPAKVGPPDGILDLVVANSNSPALPLGATADSWIVPPVGTTSARSLVYRGAADGTWTDVTDAVSTADPGGWSAAYPGGSPWGVIAADYDGDGDRDLFYPCGAFNTESRNTLLQNQGDGTLVNVSKAAGLTEVQASFAASWIDHDKDGALDLYVTNAVNLWNDLWQGSSQPDPVDRLYRNRGDGTFEDVAPAAGCDLRSNGFSLATVDLDYNGHTDVVVSCFMQYNKVFYNEGDGTFSFMTPRANPAVDVSLDILVPDPGFPGSWDFPGLGPGDEDLLPLLGLFSMPVEVADFNGDAWPDLAFATWSPQLPDAKPTSALGASFFPAERAYLYLNRGDQDGDGLGDGLFREAARETGFELIAGAMGMLAGDFNGDGAPDLYIGAGGPFLGAMFEEDYLFVNEPAAWPDDFQRSPDQPLQRAFYELGALAGTYDNVYMGHGLSALRRNGRVEVIASNGGPGLFDAGQANYYWTNTGNDDGQPYHTVAVDLRSSAGPAAVVGTRVDLVRQGDGGAGQVLVRQRQGGARFASHNTGPLVFGLGQQGLLFANARWPSGARQGQLLWPANPGPTEIVFEETTHSLALDASYPAGGGLDLTLTAEELGPQGLPVDLWFGRVGPAPGGGFQLDFLIRLAQDVDLVPGTLFALSAQLSAPPTGLYAAFLVQPGGATVFNAAGLWHDPQLEMPPAGPGSPSPPTLAPEGSGTSPQRRIESRSRVVAPGGLRFRAEAVKWAPARLPLEYSEIQLAGRGRMAFGGGTLRWHDGQAVLEGTPGTPAVLAVDDGRYRVATGRPLGCCSSVPAGEGTLFELHSVERLEVNGLEYVERSRP